MSHVSVVVATTCRPTLERTLKSIAAQAGWGGGSNEVILVGADLHRALEMVPESLDVRIVHLSAPGGDWGNRERQVGMERATGDYIAFLDDDDIWTPGALPAIRRAVSRKPDRPMMFRMVDLNGAILWQAPELKKGNVGTPMFVVPNDQRRLGTWPHHLYEGDFTFMESTLEFYETNSLVWDSSIICACRDQALNFGG